MKSNLYIIIIVLIVVAAGGWFVLSGGFFQPASYKAPVLQTSEKQATLLINYGEGEPEELQVNFSEGTTVFNLLKSKTEELDLNLKTKVYEGMGVLIEAIGDKENGQDNKYWLYYVNGEMPMVAADKLEVNESDKIEFKFEKSSF